MIGVREAEEIILSTSRSFGTEEIPFQKALGRILAEPLFSDRDLPPYNRVMMDGIAINFESFASGNRKFLMKATQAAGDKPVEITDASECIEIMTGAVLPGSTDTVIRYEDLMIESGYATVQTENIRKGTHIHYRGTDRHSGDEVCTSGQLITPAIISMAASIGKSLLPVSKLPSVIIISSGDELVDVNETPEPYQVRRSNNYAVQAVLSTYGIEAKLVHIPDDEAVTVSILGDALENHDLILISGGVSMGKFDLIPKALEKLGVQKLIHKVKQKPGKPFWFGEHDNGSLIFAFPGNPVATFLCVHRYLIPWLDRSLGLTRPLEFAALAEDLKFEPALQYFMAAKVEVSFSGQLMAYNSGNNNSGDFASLVNANAFVELPEEKNLFLKGEVYRVWRFVGGW